MSRGRLKKILTGSFLLIMLLHIAAFTAIGLSTPAGWHLLWIFLTGLGIMGLVVAPLRYFRKKRQSIKSGKNDN